MRPADPLGKGPGGRGFSTGEPMRVWSVAILTASTAFATTATAGVSFRQVESEDGVVGYAVEIDGEPFTTLVVDPAYAKPFWHPVAAPGGVSVVRGLESEDLLADSKKATHTPHPHHKGIWIAIEKVTSGGRRGDHWHERDVIRNRKLSAVVVDDEEGGYVTIGLENHWLAGGEPLLVETTEWTLTADRLIAADVTLAPPGDDAVTFIDTKEGFFSVRVANELREDQFVRRYPPGRVTDSDGSDGAKASWGRRHDWVDYAGTTDGTPAGVAIFDHPENPYRARYHVRGYGLFAANPFGESAYTNGELDPRTVTIAPGETLRLRYAAWVHGGATPEEVAARYAAYAGSAGLGEEGGDIDGEPVQ